MRVHGNSTCFLTCKQPTYAEHTEIPLMPECVCFHHLSWFWTVCHHFFHNLKFWCLPTVESAMSGTHKSTGFVGGSEGPNFASFDENSWNLHIEDGIKPMFVWQTSFCCTCSFHPITKHEIQHIRHERKTGTWKTPAQLGYGWFWCNRFSPFSTSLNTCTLCFVLCCNMCMNRKKYRYILCVHGEIHMVNISIICIWYSKHMSYFIMHPPALRILTKIVDIYISKVKWCNRMYEVLLSSHDIKLEHLIFSKMVAQAYKSISNCLNFPTKLAAHRKTMWTPVSLL